MCEGAFLAIIAIADLNSHTIYFLALIMLIEMPLTENALFLYKIYLHFNIPFTDFWECNDTCLLRLPNWPN